MIDPDLAQSALIAWSQGQPIQGSSRLASALSARSPQSSVGYADIAVLIRRCLRANDEARMLSVSDPSAFVQAWLEVPKCTMFPDKFDWSDYGLRVRSSGARGSRITADRWAPTWLDVPDGEGVDSESFAGTPCRISEDVQGDPFLTTIDTTFRSYKSPGQRAAVRSAIALPAGATLVVNLPTGAGKTLALLAAVQIAPPGTTSVVVVPTVALALDQARRYLAQNPGSPQTAYHGGLDEGEKKEFRERIWSGSQRVIFTNPEAVVASLARPLADAAKGGRLAVLGIDEAHVLGSWGDAFRPHFHSMAGLRRYLIRECQLAGHAPFKTILASATLNEGVMRLLRNLFDGPGHFYHVGAPVLRPEPSYWQKTGLSPVDRENYLIEALLHAPRPAIVYTTLRQDQRPGTLTPRGVEKLLRSAGFERLEIVDGGSTTAHREAVLRGMRSEIDSPSAIDVVVATSAFGLGIDVPDVRTVIHACLPEDIDRFYQEVGRGGRDGKASISLLLATSEDAKVAESLSAPRYLTLERASERWTSMLLASQISEDGVRRLPLTATSGNVSSNSEYNERWNLFTVVLLARSGAVQWDFSFSGLDDLGERESDRGWLTVRILRGDHQTDRFWQDVVEPTRNSMSERSRLGLFRLRSALNGTACTGVLVAESFTIQDPVEFRTVCLPSCGGCGWCRTHGKRRWTSPSPTPAAIEVHALGRTPLDRLAVNGSYGRRIAVCLDTTIYDSPRKMRSLLNNVVSASAARLIVASNATAQMARTAIENSPALISTVMVDATGDFDPITTVGVPTVVLLSDGEDAEDWIEGVSRAPLIVIIGSPNSTVGDSDLRLSEQDGSYTLTEIDSFR